MAERRLGILLVSTADILGGAEKIALELFKAYRLCGHNSWLAVGHKHSNDATILLIPNQQLRRRWTRFWQNVGGCFHSQEGRMRGAWRLKRLSQIIAEPWKSIEAYRGVEDFHFPGTWHLLEIAGHPVDILHCHNLHGSYFDLRALPWLSRKVPVVLTLHDGWLLSGHCSHSFDCERWKVGCGHCPDLTIYPAIRQDSTAYNWQRKKKIYAKNQLYVATPSRWLMQKVEESMLAPALAEARIIPNGVDLSIFQPADKRMTRQKLDIPQRSKVLLFVAHRIRKNIWKDYQTIRKAMTRVAEHLPDEEILFIALGEDSPAERIGQAEVRFVPFKPNPAKVAQYYQAADIYVHAAKVETFPITVLEAIACGTPVVATAVGGILEQVRGARIASSESKIASLNIYEPDEATGILVESKNAQAMAKAMVYLLTNEGLRKRLSENAVKDAHRRFDFHRQADEYIEWYRTILERQNTRS